MNARGGRRRNSVATDQKFSELDNDEREEVIAYVERRWLQYYSVSRETRKDAAKLIAVMNAGGAAALLAFLGAITKDGSPLARAVSLKIAIAFFVSGIVCSALAHTVEYTRLRGLFATWRAEVGKLYSDGVDFDTMQQVDVDRAGSNELASAFFVWAALGLFVLGAIVGLFLLFYGD